MLSIDPLLLCFFAVLLVGILHSTINTRYSYRTSVWNIVFCTERRTDHIYCCNYLYNCFHSSQESTFFVNYSPKCYRSTANTSTSGAPSRRSFLRSPTNQHQCPWFANCYRYNPFECKLSSRLMLHHVEWNCRRCWVDCFQLVVLFASRESHRSFPFSRGQMDSESCTTTCTSTSTGKSTQQVPPTVDCSLFTIGGCTIRCRVEFDFNRNS